MNTDWMSDARKIPDEVMNYIRRLAVHAVVDQYRSSVFIAEIFHVSRSSVYEWLAWYRREGDDPLDICIKVPGASPRITRRIERWLKRTILRSTSSDYGYDTELWTFAIISAIL